MKYEIASLENGRIFRGGVSADIRTVAKWIEQNKETDPETTYFAIPADEYAEPLKSYLNRLRDVKL